MNDDAFRLSMPPVSPGSGGHQDDLRDIRSIVAGIGPVPVSRQTKGPSAAMFAVGPPGGHP
jgi:hypothetical protein